MKYSLGFLFLLCSFASMAQTDSLGDPYKRFPTIPPFNLLGIDSSTHLTKDNIAKKHNTLIMFFAPDCPHCQHQTEEILSAMDSLKDVEIVMATYRPFGEMVDFYHKYQLDKYPNIRMGRDMSYFLPPFFNMKSLPYLALYDKKGMLITTFEGSQPIVKLYNAFEKKKEK